MDIFDYSKRTMLALMMESTGHRYYAREIHDLTGISYPIIYRNLTTFESAGLVVSQKEDLGFCPKRAARIEYEVTQRCVDFVRLSSDFT